MSHSEFTSKESNIRITFGKVYSELMLLKDNEDKTSFNDLLMRILPNVRKYIKGRLKAAIHQGHFSKGKYKPDDFVDQLFIEIYENLGELESENDFYKWLFKKTNQLLEDVIVEEEFDDLYFENIDDYSKAEWPDLIEKYTVDGGDDLVMMDEIDDPSMNQKEVMLSPFFVVDKESTMIEKIDEELTAEEVHHHINFVLDSLPLKMRNVYDLFYGAQFSIAEIAEITKISEQEVDDLIKEAKVRIKRSFEKRF